METMKVESTAKLEPTPNLASEASREANQMLSSPEDFPEDIVIDNLSHESSTSILAYAANVGSHASTTHDWMIDSGCTHHMFFDKNEFIDYQAYRTG